MKVVKMKEGDHQYNVILNEGPDGWRASFYGIGERGQMFVIPMMNELALGTEAELLGLLIEKGYQELT